MLTFCLLKLCVDMAYLDSIKDIMFHWTVLCFWVKEPIGNGYTSRCCFAAWKGQSIPKANVPRIRLAIIKTGIIEQILIESCWT